jgi:hypothetical protein
VIIIIDNCLGRYQFKSLQTMMFDPSFSWHLTPGEATYQTAFARRFNKFRKDPKLLVHCFYTSGEYDTARTKDHISPNFKWFKPLFPFCSNSDLLQVRANLVMPCGFDIRHTFYHVDQRKIDDNYTGIFYLHGDSTPTIFKTGLLTRKLVFPKANRLVLFPAYTKHAHYSPVKERRMVINFNFLSMPLSEGELGEVMNKGGHVK